ncbi:MAG: cell division initiation protein [Myxococcota bacterium]|jgi:cell division initiation protein
MRVTPLDIIQKQDTFTPSRRGYDIDEVRAFLDDVRETMEEQLREGQQLREVIARQEQEIETLRGAESSIKDTLMLAQRLSDDLTRKGRREADLIIGEARLEAQQILRGVAEERRALQTEILQLEAQRVRMSADIRAVLETHSRILDGMTASPAAAR